MGTGWLLNKEEEPLPWQIGPYQSKQVGGKPSKVRTGEQSKRRPDAVILEEPSSQKLSQHLTANPLIFASLGLQIAKEINNIGMISTIDACHTRESPEQVGSKQHQIGLASHWCIVMEGMFRWPPSVELPQNSRWENGNFWQ
jgi:hypothetical protein